MAGIVLMGAFLTTLPASDPQSDYPIQPVSFVDVHIRGGFWGPRLETNRTVTVWSNLKKCEQTGRLSNFAKAGGRIEGGFEGIFYNDSDVFKVVEGASYTLARHPDPKLDTYLDRLIADVAAAQEDDGYLYTARTINDPDYDFPGKQGRWSHLASGHELYNVGHLYEAAVAHFQATGKRTLLDVAVKNADLVCKTFGPAPGQRVDPPGHEEIEVGLVKLFRVTGDRKYLDQARFFIDMRGRKDKRQKLYGAYCQDHEPVVEQDVAVGHAVRAGYLYCGMADVAAMTGNAQYRQALDRIWESVVSARMFLTGGIGARRSGEAFGAAYELPNRTAYNETCAAIAHALWNHRMFLLTGEGKYIDVLERVLYNGFLAGVSLGGDAFFYPNPLVCDGDYAFNHGSVERSPWFDCSCCPVNVVRFVPSIAGMVYAKRADVGFVNLFAAGTGRLELNDVEVRLTQETEYPWSGEVLIRVEPARPAEFELRLRIPGWARGRPVPSDLYRYLDAAAEPPQMAVNGKSQTPRIRDGYAVIRRKWQPGDSITLRLPMPIRRVVAHDRVGADRRRVALERGPIVYCVEGVDHGGKVLNLALPDSASLRAERRPDHLGGVTVLRSAARGLRGDADGKPKVSDVEMTAIPYYAWCHRGANEMAVWLPRDPADLTLPSRAATFRAFASHCWRGDTVAALHDGLIPTSSDDHDIPRMTWWDCRGTTEWVQYDFPKPVTVRSVEVYWFDDTGRGRCRLPDSWRLLYRDGGRWKPVVDATPYTAEKDRFNRVTFEPVRTDGLRLQAKLKPEHSGGVLEWRVLP